MDDVKKCSKCKIEKFLINFQKNNITKDGQNSISTGCIKEYYLNNSIRIIQKQKDSYLKNHNRIKHYKNEKRGKNNEYEKNILKKGDEQIKIIV